MDDIHEMLQASDSEQEEDFDEYPDDPSWLPDCGDDPISNEDGYDVSPDATPPDGLSQEGALPEGVPPDGAVPIVATPASLYDFPEWKRLNKNEILNPKKLKPIKNILSRAKL